MIPRAVRPARARRCAAGLSEARLAFRVTRAADVEVIPVSTSPDAGQTLRTTRSCLAGESEGSSASAADSVPVGGTSSGGRADMASVSTWERIERQNLRRRERRIRRYRPGDRPDSSRPAGTDMLPQIKHIVVLMMENHSFDNYLGTLGRGEGFPLGDDGTPDAENPDSAGATIRAYHADSTVQEDGVPCQSWSASHTQWAAGKMNGFVTSTEQVAPQGDKTAAMAYWTDQDLPFYHGLARTFPLADRWFSSCLGPTFPNRRFLLAGTANGLMDDLPFNLLDRPRAGTIMDMLTRHGISWVNYRPD